MATIESNVKLDAEGLACSMPIVRTKKAMKDLEAGRVLEVGGFSKVVNVVPGMSGWTGRTTGIE
nr:sulfurtransferase TusA family protein [Paenibacillus sp. DMB20]